MNRAVRPDDMGQTTISVDEDVADRLYNRKGRGESYNDVLLELLELAERAESDSLGVETHATSGEESAVDTDTVATTSEDEKRSPGAHDGESEPTLDEAIDAVADDVLPGSGSKLEARREALHAVVEYLREHGEATPGDFKRDVYPDHTAGYTDGEDPARSWWKNALYKGLAELAERTDVVESADTSGKWRYVGEASS